MITEGMTAGQQLDPNMACLARDGRLFYFDDRVLRSVDTSRLKDRELYRVPAGFKPALPTCTADGRHVAFAYIEQTALSTETGRIYSTMHERFYQHPHSVIMRIDTETGEAVAAWGEETWISHVLIHPTDPNLILFCHAGGSTCVQQRRWVVDLHHQQARKAAPLYLQRPGESCVTSTSRSRATWGFSTRWTARAAARSTTPSSGPTALGSVSTASPDPGPATSSRTPTIPSWSATGPTFPTVTTTAISTSG
jgi:oligogalacturonide lyase